MSNANVDLPPIGIELGVSGDVSGGAPAPVDTFVGSFVLSSPPDGAVVTLARPTFTVAVLSDQDTDSTTYTVEVTYSANADLSAGATLSATFPAVEGGAYLTPAADVADTIYWSARLLDADGVQIHGLLTAHTFTVDTTVIPVDLPVNWTVSTSATRPIHVWHFDPAGPLVGDTVTVYGQGFPATGTLTFGDEPLPVASWTRKAATSDNASDPSRLIDGAIVTPEHYEVTFTAPADDGPGSPLTVEP